VIGLPLPAGAIRTVVIDPGHGGAEEGAHGPSGTKEKDFVLQMARRLKASIESRIGLRVLLTRDNDEAVPQDRRTALANNNKADLLISLHANASSRPQTRGAQVLSLSLADYSTRPGIEITRDLPVPVAGGGSRSIDVVPWDLAQIPFAGQSSVVASILARQLRDHGVPLYTQPTARLPLRTLVGANMPAVMLEMGFLSNTDDEQALNSPELSGNIIDALLSTIDEIRRGIPDAAPGNTAGPS
jgi:N-acetylmuramoyl-L-alanine amidase